MRGGAVVARWAHNPKVVGSSPAPATKKSSIIWALFSFIGLCYGDILIIQLDDMKKITLLLLFVSAVMYFANGQEYPQGVYMSLNDIKEKKPSQNLVLKVNKRTKKDIQFWGGNDYKLDSDDKKIKSSFLKKDIWAYSDGDALYLNCAQFDAQPWYTKLISDGRWMIFKAGILSKGDALVKQKAKAKDMGIEFNNNVGGADAAMLRFLYVLDKESGKVIAVDVLSMQELLSANQELLNNFNDDPNQMDELVQIRYLELLNNVQNTEEIN